MYCNATLHDVLNTRAKRSLGLMILKLMLPQDIVKLKLLSF